MVRYTHNWKTLWRLQEYIFRRVKTQSEVVFDEDRNPHMPCQHGSNESDVFRLADDEEYVKETDTGDELLQDSQPTQLWKGSTSHMHEALHEEAENTHSQHLCWEDQTAQHLAADAETAHSQHPLGEDQTAQCSETDAEIIALSQPLCREDHTVWRLAAAIKSASPAPPILSRVTSSQGKSSTDVLTAFEATGNPFTYAEAMESPQEINQKEPWRKKAHWFCWIIPSQLRTPWKHGNWKLSQLAPSGFTRLNTILTDPHSTKHSKSLKDTSRQMFLRLMPLFGS